MDRRAFPLSRLDPSPRAARKSEWLRSALAHHHCPDPGVENEIVVLATGIDQYLQEVFHHLAYPNRDDTVTAEDFAALCVVLGLNGAGGRTSQAKDGTGDGETDEEDEEFRDVCSRLPGQLSFRDFHSRLCGYFRVRSARRGTGGCSGRLPLTEDTELVERQIRSRWPRVRRRKSVSFDLPGDQSGPVPSKVGDPETGTGPGRHAVALKNLFHHYWRLFVYMTWSIGTLLLYLVTDYYLLTYTQQVLLWGRWEGRKPCRLKAPITATRFPSCHFSLKQQHSPLHFVWFPHSSSVSCTICSDNSLSYRNTSRIIYIMW